MQIARMSVSSVGAQRVRPLKGIFNNICPPTICTHYSSDCIPPKHGEKPARATTEVLGTEMLVI